MFYDKYVALCAQKGITPSAAAKEIGINKAAVSNWKYRKNGPSDVTIQKIADYFGVPVSELLEEKEKPAPTNEGELATDMEKKLLAVFRQVPVNRQSEVLALIEDALKILLPRQEQSE